LIGLVLVSIVAVVATSLVGTAIAQRWLPGCSGAVVAYAAGVNLAACWIAFVPLVMAHRRQARHLPWAVLGTIVIRLVLVGVGAVGAAAAGFWPNKVLAAWLVVFYLVLLAVETGWAVRFVGRGSPGTDGSTRI